VTGIDLPGEDGGRVNPLNKWGKYSTDSVAQGYELMVTPMQIARAFCAYANGGRLVDPRLIKGFLDEQGNVVARTEPKKITLFPQAIDPYTAAGMRRIMCDVVVRGTATRARSATWNIFGKTGTAHIAQHGSYQDAKLNSSFIGGAPADNPRVIIAMIIHEPDKSIAHYGGTVSAPAAGRVLERTLAYLQIPKSPDLSPPPPEVAKVLWNYNEKIYADRTAMVDE
jgi:cell division protein FtsI/penicillin-binding protein 2